MCNEYVRCNPAIAIADIVGGSKSRNAAYSCTMEAGDNTPFSFSGTALAIASSALIPRPTMSNTSSCALSSNASASAAPFSSSCPLTASPVRSPATRPVTAAVSRSSAGCSSPASAARRNCVKSSFSASTKPRSSSAPPATSASAT